MNQSQNSLKTFLIACPLAVIFIAIPGALAKFLYMRFALSPRVLPLWLDAGIPGFILGFGVPSMVCLIAGMIIGFCSGVFVASKFISAQEMRYWLLSGKQIPVFTKFASRIIDVVYR